MCRRWHPLTPVDLLVALRYECVLALGFVKMERGGLSHHYLDRPHPEEAHFGAMHQLHPESQASAPVRFNNAWTENCTKLFGCAAKATLLCA